MTDFVIINGEKIPRVKCDSKTTITNIKTGKVYKNEEELKLDNADPKDIKRDVKIIIPKGFDVFGEKPLK
jgi:hypothetical protein|tara:strand:- start:1260 stop:1469 length:210 start_codon:yes stop_codon:yes gene_type:complete